VIEDMVAFLDAFIILSMIFLFVLVASAVFLNDEVKLNLVLDEDTGSKVCDQNLLNYLRASTSSGIRFSQLISFAEINSDSKKNLITETNAFFEDYKRGDSTREKWFLHISKDNVPIVKTGELQTAKGDDTCKQYIPSLKDGKLIATLGVEY
ncbi:MAG: hypothetical protein AABW84_01375, partial [Nanoarchaeota archaeon]